MRIDSSSIGLQSRSSSYSMYTKKEELEIKSPGQGTPSLHFAATQMKAEANLASWQDMAQKNTTPSLRDKANQLAQLLKPNNNQPNQVSSASSNDDNSDLLANLPPDEKLKLLLLIQLLGRIQNDPELMKALGLDDDSLQKTLQSNMGQQSVTNTQSTTPAATMNYTSSETLYQSETSQFSAQGVVKTADGKTINIDVNLTMSRESMSSKDTQLRLQAATQDPLVINFDGNAAELSDKRFSFDLTADGTKDSIPMLMRNSAFLALDKNNDGTINDGNELFGAKTGDGFAELAQYDDDKNGWIDENDAVFNNLKLWTNAGSNQQKLSDLKSANIGAIYLGSAQTPFHLQEKNDDQSNLGIIQSTGIFLKENGGVGTIQHVDLTV